MFPYIAFCLSLRQISAARSAFRLNSSSTLSRMRPARMAGVAASSHPSTVMVPSWIRLAMRAAPFPVYQGPIFQDVGLADTHAGLGEIASFAMSSMMDWNSLQLDAHDPMHHDVSFWSS
ncbi:MAG: hypothetical protein R3C13_12020 [Hyphomonas sp.]|uniref:hypothetical protein n=1 Tax=Hyphomonas sp. TaxID=87 RepID=UPI0035288CF6